MNFLEKDLEDFIYKSSPFDLSEEYGLEIPITPYIYRQLNIGKYGIADIVAVDRVGYLLDIHVYELKKDKIDCSTVLQCLRYCQGIRSYLNTHRFWDKPLSFHVHCVGNFVEKNKNIDILDEYAEHCVPYPLDMSFSFWKYEITCDGIRFSRHKAKAGSKDEGFDVDRDFYRDRRYGAQPILKSI